MCSGYLPNEAGGSPDKTANYILSLNHVEAYDYIRKVRALDEGRL